MGIGYSWVKRQTIRVHMDHKVPLLVYGHYRATKGSLNRWLRGYGVERRITIYLFCHGPCDLLQVERVTADMMAFINTEEPEKQSFLIVGGQK